MSIRTTPPKPSSHPHHEKPEMADEVPSNESKRHHYAKASDRATKGYDAMMADIIRPMPLRMRLFSKLIHYKPVEIASGLLAATLARPNAILTGSVLSFTLTLGLYVLAKNLGYSLSGFESIGAFILGWILGLVYDLLSLMIRGKR